MLHVLYVVRMKWLGMFLGVNGLQKCFGHNSKQNSLLYYSNFEEGLSFG